MIPRLRYALAAYALLALLAGFTLDGKFRIFIWLLMVVFALKSWVADKTRRNESDTEPRA